MRSYKRWVAQSAPVGDRALILLLDQRHTDRTYSSLLPERTLRMNATNAPTTDRELCTSVLFDGFTPLDEV